MSVRTLEKTEDGTLTHHSLQQHTQQCDQRTDNYEELPKVKTYYTQILCKENINVFVLH